MTPKQQLDGFIGKFEPGIARQARAAVKAMRAKFPHALALVYDNYNALAIGFGPSERASEAIFSIAVFPKWVSLFFLQGAGLKDPKTLLKGSGNQARHIVLTDLALLDHPDVEALMQAALASAKVPLDANAEGGLIIKSVSAKQRPRRPPARPTKRA
jgi:hypothetical protein